MLRAERVEHQGAWPRDKARGTVTLAYLDRHRRRIRLIADTGEAFLLDLERATVLEEGDGLALSDGGWIAVEAAVEELVEVTAASPELLLRIVWHLGNRHLPAQIEAGRILIRTDHVIVDMLRGLGAEVRAVTAPFRPEGGAYEGGHHHHGDDEAHHHHHDHHHD
jgi:urease accessory protein